MMDDVVETQEKEQEQQVNKKKKDDDDDDEHQHNNINKNNKKSLLMITTTILALSSTTPNSTLTSSSGFDKFPQGCQFSPDGSCLLTATCHQINLYNTPNNSNGQQQQQQQQQIEDENDKIASSDYVSSSPSGPNTGWNPVLTYPTGGSVRCYTWYPHMASINPATCCFVGVSHDQPCHLYDAYTGTIRASYCPYNALDEMESPSTMCFAARGQQLVTGGFHTNRMIHVFDINRPGRDSTSILKLGKTRQSKDGQKGLVSAIRYTESFGGLLAVGTYSPGSIYLYDIWTYCKSPTAEVVMTSSTCIAGHGKNHHHGRKRKHFVSYDDDDDDGDDNDGVFNFSAAKIQWYQSRVRGGVTQLEFDDDNGTSNVVGDDCKYLFSTSRRSNAIIQWDLRKLSTLPSSTFCPGVGSYETDNDTNQRIEFQLDKSRKQLWTGGTDGCIRVYNYQSRSRVQVPTTLERFGDCVNGISLYRNSSDSGGDNTQLLALTTGSRHFPSFEDNMTENDADSGDGDNAGNNNNGGCIATTVAVESLCHSVGTTQVHRIRWEEG